MKIEGLIVSPEDADFLAHKWRLDTSGYARRNVHIVRKQCYQLYLHREVCLRVFGAVPSGRMFLCDHINRNKLDNRRENLRIISSAESAQNKDFGPFRGTSWNSKTKRWTATARRNYRTYHAGTFLDREEAAKAAAAKRKELGIREPFTV